MESETANASPPLEESHGSDQPTAAPSARSKLLHALVYIGFLSLVYLFAYLLDTFRLPFSASHLLWFVILGLLLAGSASMIVRRFPRVGVSGEQIRILGILLLVLGLVGRFPFFFITPALQSRVYGQAPGMTYLCGGMAGAILAALLMARRSATFRLRASAIAVSAALAFLAVMHARHDMFEWVLVQGFRWRIARTGGMDRLQNWVVTVLDFEGDPPNFRDPTTSPHMNVNRWGSQQSSDPHAGVDVPRQVWQLEPVALGIWARDETPRKDRFVGFSYGGGFFHYSLVVGRPDMTYSHRRLRPCFILRPGVYLWVEGCDHAE